MIPYLQLYSLNKRNALRAEGSSGHSSGRQDRAVINAELFSTGGIRELTFLFPRHMITEKFL